MSKNIVICADGTGNTFETQVSNVTRAVKSLDLSNEKAQIVFYDQGVGTRRTDTAKEYARSRPGLRILQEPRTAWWLARPLARWFGQGFGYGLYENIREMYEALVTNYEEGDRIHLLGFSRGAFTVRALAGFVNRCGLLPVDRLHLFSSAYKCLYREQHFDAMDRCCRDELTRGVDRFWNDNGVRPCTIHFLGIWDTVKSYGFIYPVSLPHLRHNPIVVTVRHALALHERRSYFQPTSWGGVDHPFYDDRRSGESGDVKEVWFAGSHSDVGGGYEACENGLSRFSFEWMLREARACGLSLDDCEFERMLREFSDDLDVHESLHGFGWWLTELLPRFELQNVPMAGKRVLKWGSTGTRDPLHMTRDKRMSVHPSVPQVLSALGLALAQNESIKIAIDTEWSASRGPASLDVSSTRRGPSADLRL